jgi:hypothetical protein
MSVLFELASICRVQQPQSTNKHEHAAMQHAINNINMHIPLLYAQ